MSVRQFQSAIFSQSVIFFVLGLVVVVSGLAGCTTSGPTASAATTDTPGATPGRPIGAVTPEVPAPEAETIGGPGLGNTQSRSRDGMVMVYVPAGQFEMGSSDTQVDQALRVCEEVQGDCERRSFKNQQPAHTVALGPFWIDQTEVTNELFTAFLNEQGNQVEEGISWLEPGAGHRGIVYGYIRENDGAFRTRSGYSDHPVIEVSWYGAAAYCSWAGGRLPTEAEWAYAARGPQGRVYPWGDTFDGERTNYCDASCSYKWRDRDFNDGSARWAPVGSYPGGASWCGAFNMVGNVWEWVNDFWSDDYYAHSPTDNPHGPDTGTMRIARGGSWFDERWRVSASCRKALTPSSYRMHWVGFRCIVPAEP